MNMGKAVKIFIFLALFQCTLLVPFDRVVSTSYGVRRSFEGYYTIFEQPKYTAINVGRLMLGLGTCGLIAGAFGVMSKKDKQ